MKTRSVLSCLALSLLLGACAPDSGVTADDDPITANGIGTSPSDPGPVQFDALGAIKPCGLWIAASLDLAEARHAAAPASPDMAQYPLPGGLACSALVAAVPAVQASRGGVAVVRYFDAEVAQ